MACKTLIEYMFSELPRIADIGAPQLAVPRLPRHNPAAVGRPTYRASGDVNGLVVPVGGIVAITRIIGVRVLPVITLSYRFLGLRDTDKTDIRRTSPYSRAPLKDTPGLYRLQISIVS